MNSRGIIRNSSCAFFRATKARSRITVLIDVVLDCRRFLLRRVLFVRVVDEADDEDDDEELDEDEDEECALAQRDIAASTTAANAPSRPTLADELEEELREDLTETSSAS